MNDRINVTKPNLPPLEDFIPFLQEIWDSGIITNNGPYHNKLEDALCEYLGVSYISLFCNGTIALVTALKALRISGEVITTPFSFVATAHALWWNNITPVFVDIDPETLNLDPKKIEEAITPETTAILPVHCYGNPCSIDQIDQIAADYNLRVIYDAAHAFGVNCHCGSILNHGDLSVLSFHATKVFNTFEGGAIVSPDARTKKQIDHLKNFGFVDETTVVAAGINGKMNELQAAMGILQLKNIDEAIGQRTHIARQYERNLSTVNGIRYVRDTGQSRSNHSYSPIIVEQDYPLTRDELYFMLQKKGFYGRRYFYPLISTFPMYRQLPSARESNLRSATHLSEQILCLPIYPDLPLACVDEICSIIASNSSA